MLVWARERGRGSQEMVSWALGVSLLLWCLGGRQRVLGGRGPPSFRALNRTKLQVLPLHPIGSYLSMCLNLGQTHHSEWWPLFGPYPEKVKSQFTLDFVRACKRFESLCSPHVSTVWVLAKRPGSSGEGRRWLCDAGGTLIT